MLFTNPLSTNSSSLLYTLFQLSTIPAPFSNLLERDPASSSFTASPPLPYTSLLLHLPSLHHLHSSVEIIAPYLWTSSSLSSVCIRHLTTLSLRCGCATRISYRVNGTKLIPVKTYLFFSACPCLLLRPLVPFFVFHVSSSVSLDRHPHVLFLQRQEVSSERERERERCHCSPSLVWAFNCLNLLMPLGTIAPHSISTLL